MSVNNERNLHKGHRQRLKKRYVDENGEGFCDHELIELLLFYGVPRKNVNEMAHELYERFGSISGLASADIDELKLVKGVGDSTAVLIKLVTSLAQRIAAEQNVPKKRLNTLKALAEYAQSYLLGATVEQVYLIMMDNSLRVIDTKLIAVGSLKEVKPTIRRALELIILKRASAVALAHNHPNGGVEASYADVEFTSVFKCELDVIDVRFVEHIVVDGSSYNAIMRHLSNKENIDVDLTFDDPRAN